MRTVCEVTWRDEEGDKPKVVKEMYYLLHWGLKMEIIGETGVSHTVAVCEHYETGQIECFLPEQLKILGIKTNK